MIIAGSSRSPTVIAHEGVCSKDKSRELSFQAFPRSRSQGVQSAAEIAPRSVTLKMDLKKEGADKLTFYFVPEPGDPLSLTLGV